MAFDFKTLDDIRDDLKAKHPGWRIWFVPQVGRGVTWCASRQPQAAEASPEDLSKAIDEIEKDWRAEHTRDVWKAVWGDEAQGCSL